MIGPGPRQPVGNQPLTRHIGVRDQIAGPLLARLDPPVSRAQQFPRRNGRSFRFFLIFVIVGAQTCPRGSRSRKNPPLAR